MIWPTREPHRLSIVAALQQYDATVERLPGLASPRRYESLSCQIIASQRREDYYRFVQVRPSRSERADPQHQSFDPERAVAWHLSQGDVDEASWLIFLMTHFARPSGTGWLRLRDVYGMLGAGVWTWGLVSQNPTAFSAWVDANAGAIRGKFGNHRKYESLRADADRPIGVTVSDYVRLIGPNGHAAFFANIALGGANDRFDYLYRRLAVRSFGRLAKFDYLMLLSRYGLVPMVATQAYLAGATGPKRGARLLFDGNADSGMSPAHLQQKLSRLDAVLNLGMSVWEDSICNWQKSPDQFVHYTG